MVVGRFQPPTLGHQVVLDQLRDYSRANGLVPIVFIVDGATTSLDTRQNPMSSTERLQLMRKWFPDVRMDVIGSAYEAMDVLQLQDLEPVVWFAGSDRVKRYQGILVHAGYPNSHVVEIERTQGIAAGVSGTKARQVAAAGDIGEFRRMLPTRATPEDLQRVMRLLRLGQGINEL